MEVKAQLNNLRLAPRKVRAVTNLIKGKNVTEALGQLEHFVRRPVNSLKKLLNSAIANAENNFNMVKDNLYIKKLIVDEGIKLKRFRAKGFGRAAAIQKKTSHIWIVLDERTPGLRREKTAKAKPPKASLAQGGKEITEEVVKETGFSETKKPEIKRELGKKSNVLGNLGRKIFQRKSI
ncbi:MAG: 50S ribosomal protein L22 [Candidatus Yanofskybacteria bacterium RIFCSPHIGHO2_02_FULL_38_22b]|uniref:Large ribosomal subunit protein uL22 n=1 Tax=Candidatus Yanofskybacteria bacterium RIFCSPHIGHO2_02_FULL_38_22b TaxID=1802673 RepID=A0A1F8F1V1_9BACT|nr:MAG: 50S ribosomal protein L22 [Candidatus Yanofskybacteria bacterium RIFCSPHIGHO2_01_FULL_39_44]OGN07111.1 MAG: 50S ribosomal protein L22 [Candidatus Yanofskybacteria bacterium RIFCSPHIGHO2_02_FULL_38_22b]OGN19961.1 MAG: 50S ribosomal protein L22 [Candidatus Yanofskybacteria bacterium RIFCSPLOWO2_01_FULL_39_28]